MRVDIAGVEADVVTNSEALQKISEFVASGQPHLIVTTYSEFVVFAHKDADYQRVINSAALSVPDGIGILWAAKYLSLKAGSKISAIWQVVYSGASLIFYPSYSRTIIKEQVTGRSLVWDIAKLASEKNYSLALVGGRGSVAKSAGDRLRQKYPNLKINLAECPDEFNDAAVQRIAESKSDILLIAYQPPKQEKWLSNNLGRLNVKVAMGLGGTFDYLAGLRRQAPSFVHYLGLEWLWRLVTQPWRIKRIWNAIWVFISVVYADKLKKQNL